MFVTSSRMVVPLVDVAPRMVMSCAATTPDVQLFEAAELHRWIRFVKVPPLISNRTSLQGRLLVEEAEPTKIPSVKPLT